jgi:succinylglutamate desuccinylase
MPKNRGSSSFISAGVHGDETNGVEININLFKKNKQT